MNTILLILLTIAIIHSEPILCPPKTTSEVMCTFEYSPVCALDVNGNILRTASNGCAACSDRSTIKYTQGPCLVVDPAPTTPTSTITAKTVVTITNCPKDLNILCQSGTGKSQVCGIFNQTVQCLVAPCTSTFNSDCAACSSGNVSSFYDGQCLTTEPDVKIIKCPFKYPNEPAVTCPTTVNNVCGIQYNRVNCTTNNCTKQYVNECVACQSADVVSYTVGSCAQLTGQDDDTYIECTEPRPEICDASYTDTCGLLESPCYNETCMKKASGGCNACSDKNVKGYYKGSCESYISGLAETTCDLNRPQMCAENLDVTCGITDGACEQGQCEIEFTNPCLACLNSSIKSFRKGPCQGTEAYLVQLGVAIILALIQ